MNSDETERLINLDDQMFDALGAAVNTRKINNVNFDQVQQTLPPVLNPTEVEDIRSQFIDRVFEERPDWDGSVRKLNARMVYSIGLAACTAGDLATAKSAQKVVFRQGPAFGWLYSLSLRHEINKRTH